MSEPKPKSNLLGTTSKPKRKVNVPSIVKKKTKLGYRPGTASPETDHTKDKPMQAAIRGGTKYGMPYESRAYKSGSEPMDYAKKKSKPAPAKTSSAKTPPKAESKSTAEKRAEMKPIKGISNTGGALTRTLPSDAIGKAKVKGVDATKKKSYSEKDVKIAAAMQKGKKKDGTMKASAQRKIARIRKSK